MRNLVSPARTGDKTFDELIQPEKDHFNSKPSKTVERFKFSSRNRKPGKTVTALRKSAKFCNYGDK